MIGSNPDSQYSVPKIVGWEELRREERPPKKKLCQPWNGKLTENERVGENNEMGETFETKEHDQTCVASRDRTRQQSPPDELPRNNFTNEETRVEETILDQRSGPSVHLRKSTMVKVSDYNTIRK